MPNANYKNYKKARNAAWRTLIACGVDTLPVDLRKICGQLGYELYAYSKAGPLIAAFRVEDQAQASDGFTVVYEGVPRIFYNDAAPIGRQRFTIAHEIGHVVLGHFDAGRFAIWRRRAPDPDADETQANQFGARLLAPACVLHALDAETPEEIAQLCGMSITAAGYRAGRLAQLRGRDRFLIHPLERRVLRQFTPFIQARSRS